MKHFQSTFCSVAVCIAGLGSFVTVARADDQMLAKYFRHEVERLQARNFTNVTTLGDWTRERTIAREQLREMLGLSPSPPRADLKPLVTGREDHPEFFVDKLAYQSLPGLYVTANLYVPKHLTGKVPAILYACGHASEKDAGVSYGAKAHYQHHGAWFARQGYVCLIIDTIQLGEVQGVHDGTFRQGMWWWNARGYTPAGVETWNAIRGLDYLQSRPEVDGNRIGMTGRSGGGAYTWLTAALDDRVKVAAPVSGITDLQNQVLDGCVSRHCDCMFFINTYRWDFGQLAALTAPRPLLMANGDKESLFPLDGVLRIHTEVAAIYRLYNAVDKFGLLITEGPHKDTQDLQLPVLRWFNRFLKGEDPLINLAAVKFFQPQQLKVFSTVPADERNTSIQNSFVPAAAPPIPADATAFHQQSHGWIQALREKSFAGWPAAGGPLRLTLIAEQTTGPVTCAHWEFTSQEFVRLPLLVLFRGDRSAIKQIRVRVVDELGWLRLLATIGSARCANLGFAISKPVSSADPVRSEEHETLFAQMECGEFALVYLPPRGIGPTAWSGNDKEVTNLRRRFMLLGQTLDGMRVWDIRRALEAVRQPEVCGDHSTALAGERDQAVNALYASLFSDGVTSVEMIEPPHSHATGPDYLSVLRYLDVPQAVVLAAERQPVKLVRTDVKDWAWTTSAVRQLGWAAERVQW